MRKIVQTVYLKLVALAAFEKVCSVPPGQPKSDTDNHI